MYTRILCYTISLLLKKIYSHIIFISLVLLTFSSCKIRKENKHIVKKESTEIKELHLNKALQKEINQWLGTPYKYGGNDRAGVDCSGFVQSVFRNVYNINLPRTSKEIFAKSIKIKTEHLREGDLVFFDYEQKGVSHVGIYLGDGKYIHASSTKGVVISDFNNEYTRKKFVGAGRFKK